MKGHSSKSPGELKISFSKAEALGVPLVCFPLRPGMQRALSCSDVLSCGAGGGEDCPAGGSAARTSTSL